MTHTKLTHISLNSQQEKSLFLNENNIGPNEIADQGSGWIVLIESVGSKVEWQNNGYVYSVTQVS